MATLLDITKHALGTSIYAQLTMRYPKPTASLAGRTYIVTGSNTGLGLALATHLARLGSSRIILGVRDHAKGAAAREKIIQETQFDGALEVWNLDMAEFASVARFAKRAENELKRLDGACLNAAAVTTEWQTTPDGWEVTLQVNSISTGLLGVLLLPLLQKTARLPAIPGTKHAAPHLTITGSAGQNLARFPERLEDEILNTLNDESKYNLFDRYLTSKLLNYFTTKKTADLAQAEGVIVNVVDPGLNHSDLSRHMKLPLIARAMIQMLGWPPSYGALNILHALIDETPSGIYISRSRTQNTAYWLTTAHGEEVGDRVWAEMVRVWESALPDVDIQGMVAGV
ncbi:retinol dehydrogenase [Mycena filopes]|nr:retinol dehydrogenase [Mycena filopes]